MRGRFLLGTLSAALFTNVVFIVWGRQTFMPLGIVWVSAALLGVLLLTLAAILQAFNKARPDPAARLSIRMSVASAIVCFALLPSVPVLSHLHRVDLRRGREAAEALIPLLERYRTEHGVYPTHLGEIYDGNRLPWLLREPDAYRSTGTGYVLQIRHPGNPFLADVRRQGEPRWRVIR